MSATAPDRPAAMLARVDRTMQRLGMAPADRARLRTALEATLRFRLELLRDDHHPDALHPARTALILTDDLGRTDPTTLTAAVLVETRDPRFAPPSGTLREAGGDVAGVVAAVPGEDVPEERRLEALLAAPEPALVVALAERLDHARHLHLRDEQEWRAYHRVTCAAYAAVAARSHPALGRRFDWWCLTFERRFLGP